MSRSGRDVEKEEINGFEQHPQCHAPAGFSIQLSPKVAAGVKPFDPKRLSDHVLLRSSRPTWRKCRRPWYPAEQIKELEQWWANLKIDLRDSPFVNDGVGVVIIWTFCGTDDPDFEGGVFGDDCE